VALLGCFGCLVAVTAALALQIDPASLLLYTQAAALPAVTASVYVARRWLDKRSFASLGLQLDRSAWRDVLAGFGIAGVMMGFVYLLESAAGWLTFAGPAWQFEPPDRVRGRLDNVGDLHLCGLVRAAQPGYWLQNLEEGLNCPRRCSFPLVFRSSPCQPEPFGDGFWGWFWQVSSWRITGARRLWLPIGLHIGWNFFRGDCVWILVRHRGPPA
jgi:membrane protease YdiL (CAAX protease family)